MVQMNKTNYSFIFLAVLRPGVVSVTENDGKLNKIFVSSGTVTVNDDSSVQVGFVTPFLLSIFSLKLCHLTKKLPYLLYIF